MESIELRDIETLQQSHWFDGQWYASHYPDVGASGLTPEVHYLTFGEKWGRWAGPRFDASYYRENHPDIAHAGVGGLLHFIRHGEREGRWPFKLHAQTLETALWRQEDTPTYLAMLTETLEQPDQWEASYAAWALARWYAWQQAWEKCAEVLARFHGSAGSVASAKPATAAPGLLEAEALMNSGQLVASWQRIQRLRENFPNYGDAHLAFANLLSVQMSEYVSTTKSAVSEHFSNQYQAQSLTEHLRLDHINTLFVDAGLRPIALFDETRPLAIDNLCTRQVAATARVQPTREQALVSIIVPVYNAEAHLQTALQSLAEQTYPEIEIIVVDDASTDGSLEIARSFSQRDGRFRVISQSVNQGAYASRNKGLEMAKGEFISVHDSDDWSHPQKIERQVDGLVKQGEWKACFSDWVRCSTNMVFTRWRIEAMDGWIYRNTSSFMFRREVADRIGFWDKVRVEGDGEYIRRFIAAFGAKALGGVAKGVPLSFGRSLPSSLSQAGPTHLATQYSGLRRDYTEAAIAWHAAAKEPDDLYLGANPDKRPFPAPKANLLA